MVFPGNNEFWGDGFAQSVRIFYQVKKRPKKRIKRKTESRLFVADPRFVKTFCGEQEIIKGVDKKCVKVI